MLLTFGSFVATDNNDATESCQNCTQNETLVMVASQDPILGKYEHSNKSFSKLTFGNYTSYQHQRKIDEAVVGFDGITYIFDGEGELIDNVTRWRNDLPDKLPQIISKEDAESIGGGEAVELLYIDPVLDDIFASIQPTPTNPCWIVYVYNSIDNFTYVSDIVVVDAVTGERLGHGIPPPSGYALTGSYWLEKCTDPWLTRVENAQYWFNTMGYSTPNIAVYPDDNSVKGALQDTGVVVFYEVAHGNSWQFWSGCGNSTTSYEIRDWLEGYPKMPFAFLMSCDSQCDSGMITSATPSLSYALRKGSYINTATIGFCGMGDNLDAWREGLQWQGKFFQTANNGNTVKKSFDLANAYYQTTAQCSRFAGDSSLKLVPSIKSRQKYSSDLIGKVSFEGRGDPPSNRWVEEFEVRFFQYGKEMSWSPVSATTDRDGYFEVFGIPPGTYDIGIKNWTCLSEMVYGVVLN